MISLKKLNSLSMKSLCSSVRFNSILEEEEEEEEEQKGEEGGREDSLMSWSQSEEQGPSGTHCLMIDSRRSPRTSVAEMTLGSRTCTYGRTQ